MGGHYVPLKGKLMHKKAEMSELTSISFFTDDVERLLRDLYGDLDGDDLDELLSAIKLAVLTLSSYLLPELGSEYDNAVCADTSAGCGLGPDEGVSTITFTEGVKAADILVARARRILADPRHHSRYTVKFATALKMHWRKFDG